MGGWRSKLILLLIVYFAGFATAIYCLAPASENQELRCGDEKIFTRFSSEEFADSFNKGMHKCIDFGKSAAVRMGAFLREKVVDEMTNVESEQRS